MRCIPLASGLLLLVSLPLSGQAPASVTAGCEVVQGLSTPALLERERLASYDIVGRTKPVSFWRELGCIRAALTASGNKSREGVLMIAGTSWQQGAINTYLHVLNEAPTDSPTLNTLGVLILDDWYADSLGAVGRAILRGAEGGSFDREALRACSVAAFWAKDHATARGCAQHGLGRGWDSTFHALALTRVAAGQDDTTGTTAAFDMAVVAAQSSADRDALRWHLQWFLSPEEQGAVDSTEGAEFGRRVRDAVARRDVRDGRAPGARLVEHFHRLEYAEERFAMLRPRAERERLRTLPATIIFPDNLVDSLRDLRARQRAKANFDLPSGAKAVRDLYELNDPRPHEVPALPFREYSRWQVDLDDRGVVHLRFGAPVQRIPRMGRYTMRELWLYTIDGEKLLVHFESEAFSGSLEATRLVTGVLGDYMCDVDAHRCKETSEAIRGQLKPENLTTIKTQDREFLAAATTKDDNGARPQKTVRLLASAYSLWQPQTGARVTVLPYAIRLRDLGKAPGDSLLVPLTLQARSWDGAAGVGEDTIIVRRLRAPRNAGGDDYLTGTIALPGTAGFSAWSLFVSQGDDRGGRYYDEHHEPLSTGPLVLSDVVLGAPSQKLSWKDGALVLPLAPLQGFQRNEPVALYVQVQSAAAHAEGVTLQVVIARPATKTSSRKVELTVGYQRAMSAGLNEVQQEVDVSRLEPGNYELEITVTSKNGGLHDRRRAPLVIR